MVLVITVVDLKQELTKQEVYIPNEDYFSPGFMYSQKIKIS